MPGRGHPRHAIGKTRGRMPHTRFGARMLQVIEGIPTVRRSTRTGKTGSTRSPLAFASRPGAAGVPFPSQRRASGSADPRPNNPNHKAEREGKEDYQGSRDRPMPEKEIHVNHLRVLPGENDDDHQKDNNQNSSQRFHSPTYLPCPYTSLPAEVALSSRLRKHTSTDLLRQNPQRTPPRRETRPSSRPTALPRLVLGKTLPQV